MQDWCHVLLLIDLNALLFFFFFFTMFLKYSPYLCYTYSIGGQPMERILKACICTNPQRKPVVHNENPEKSQVCIIYFWCFIFYWVHFIVSTPS